MKMKKKFAISQIILMSTVESVCSNFFFAFVCIDPMPLPYNNSQHPLLFSLIGFDAPISVNCFLCGFGGGWDCILFLICAAMVKKACSTLVAFLADVSKKGMVNSSANALAASYSTARLLLKSDLLPTNNLHTFSEAYRSISNSHCLTLSKDSLSVMSYTMIMP
eukprot:3900_1